MNKLMQTVTENVAYVVIFLAVIVGCFLVAVVLEKGAQKRWHSSISSWIRD